MLQIIESEIQAQGSRYGLSSSSVSTFMTVLSNYLSYVYIFLRINKLIKRKQ